MIRQGHRERGSIIHDEEDQENLKLVENQKGGDKEEPKKEQAKDRAESEENVDRNHQSSYSQKKEAGPMQSRCPYYKAVKNEREMSTRTEKSEIKFEGVYNISGNDSPNAVNHKISILGHGSTDFDCENSSHFFNEINNFCRKEPKYFNGDSKREITKIIDHETFDLGSLEIEKKINALLEEKRSSIKKSGPTIEKEEENNVYIEKLPEDYKKDQIYKIYAHNQVIPEEPRNCDESTIIEGKSEKNHVPVIDQKKLKTIEQEYLESPTFVFDHQGSRRSSRDKNSQSVDTKRSVGSIQSAESNNSELKKDKAQIDLDLYNKNGNDDGILVEEAQPLTDKDEERQAFDNLNDESKGNPSVDFLDKLRLVDINSNQIRKSIDNKKAIEDRKLQKLTKLPAPTENLDINLTKKTISPSPTKFAGNFDVLEPQIESPLNQKTTERSWANNKNFSSKQRKDSLTPLKRKRKLQPEYQNTHSNINSQSKEAQKKLNLVSQFNGKEGQKMDIQNLKQIFDKNYIDSNDNSNRKTYMENIENTHEPNKDNIEGICKQLQAVEKKNQDLTKEIEDVLQDLQTFENSAVHNQPEINSDGSQHHSHVDSLERSNYENVKIMGNEDRQQEINEELKDLTIQMEKSLKNLRNSSYLKNESIKAERNPFDIKLTNISIYMDNDNKQVPNFKQITGKKTPEKTDMGKYSEFKTADNKKAQLSNVKKNDKWSPNKGFPKNNSGVENQGFIQDKLNDSSKENDTSPRSKSSPQRLSPTRKKSIESDEKKSNGKFDDKESSPLKKTAEELTKKSPPKKVLSPSLSADKKSMSNSDKKKLEESTSPADRFSHKFIQKYGKKINENINTEFYKESEKCIENPNNTDNLEKDFDLKFADSFKAINVVNGGSDRDTPYSRQNYDSGDTNELQNSQGIVDQNNFDSNEGCSPFINNGTDSIEGDYYHKFRTDIDNFFHMDFSHKSNFDTVEKGKGKQLGSIITLDPIEDKKSNMTDIDKLINDKLSDISKSMPQINKKQLHGHTNDSSECSQNTPAPRFFEAEDEKLMHRERSCEKRGNEKEATNKLTSVKNDDIIKGKSASAPKPFKNFPTKDYKKQTDSEELVPDHLENFNKNVKEYSSSSNKKSPEQDSNISPEQEGIQIENHIEKTDVLYIPAENFNHNDQQQLLQQQQCLESSKITTGTSQQAMHIICEEVEDEYLYSSMLNNSKPCHNQNCDINKQLENFIQNPLEFTTVTDLGGAFNIGDADLVYNVNTLKIKPENNIDASDNIHETGAIELFGEVIYKEGDMRLNGPANLIINSDGTVYYNFSKDPGFYRKGIIDFLKPNINFYWVTMQKLEEKPTDSIKRLSLNGDLETFKPSFGYATSLSLQINGNSIIGIIPKPGSIDNKDHYFLFGMIDHKENVIKGIYVGKISNGLFVACAENMPQNVNNNEVNVTFKLSRCGTRYMVKDPNNLLTLKIEQKPNFDLNQENQSKPDCVGNIALSQDLDQEQVIYEKKKDNIEMIVIDNNDDNSDKKEQIMEILPKKKSSVEAPGVFDSSPQGNDSNMYNTAHVSFFIL